MAAHCEKLRVLATHNGLGYLQIDTSFDPRGVMRQLLRATARLRRRGQATSFAGAYGDGGFDAEAFLNAD